MSLFDAIKGKSYKVLTIRLDEAVQKRFEMLGMTANARVDVLNKKKNGALIIKVRGTRFAIGKIFAQGIIVGENENG